MKGVWESGGGGGRVSSYRYTRQVGFGLPTGQLGLLCYMPGNMAKHL